MSLPRQYTVDELAQVLDAPLVGNGNTLIHGVAPLYRAKDGELSFCSKANQKKFLESTQASVVLVPPDKQNLCKTNVIVVDDPYVAYAKVATKFDVQPQPTDRIHPHATVDASVKLGAHLDIGAGAVVQADCHIGDNVVIGAGCFIGRGVTLGAGTRLWPNVTVMQDVQIGEQCCMHSGAVIGSDGFGYANEQGKWLKIPQFGRVIIGNHVDIGANTTIDRGALDDTIIADQVIIDNLCHIAHNVSIGYGSALAGGVIIAGGSVIGRHCLIGGASVINGYIEICDHVKITGMCMLMRSVTESGVYSSGIPAQENRTWRKTAARVLHIEDLHKRLLEIEKRVLKKLS